MEHQEKRSDDVVSIELTALTTIVKALQALSPSVRDRIIKSTMTLLGGSVAGSLIHQQSNSPDVIGGGDEALSRVSQQTQERNIADIRTLKEQKQPRTATEMATLVAYYLTEIAPLTERTDKISSTDLTKYFKQAGFKLPVNPKMTLVHSKNAGYLDALGSGDYQLNPVGYNLVTHNLPGKTTGSTTQKKQKTKSRKLSKKGPARGKK